MDHNNNAFSASEDESVSLRSDESYDSLAGDDEYFPPSAEEYSESFDDDSSEDIDEAISGFDFSVFNEMSLYAEKSKDAGPFLVQSLTTSELTTSSAHFQSADFLAVGSSKSTKDTVVAVCKGADVLLYSLKYPSQPKNTWNMDVIPLGGSAIPFAANDQNHTYSMSFNSKASVLAVGCDGGMINIFLVDPSKPPCPDIPAKGSSMCHDAGLLVPYAPMLPSLALMMSLDACHKFDYPELELYLKDNGKRKLHKEDTRKLQNSTGLLEAAACEGAHRTLTFDENYDRFEGLMEGSGILYEDYYWKHYLELGGKITNLFPRIVKSKQKGYRSSKHGAIMLGAAFTVGVQRWEENVPIENRQASNEHAMVNGVRFGLVSGVERLLAAEQGGFVYVLEMPNLEDNLESSHPNGLAASLACQELSIKGKWTLKPLNAFTVRDHEFGVSMNLVALPTETVAFGPFPGPCNLAVASPDGRWIAVVGDFEMVFLLDQDNAFCEKSLPFSASSQIVEREEVDRGSQYCAFNSLSTSLAVSSDSLHAVFVYSLPSGTLTHRLQDFVKPILPIQFAPWDPNILVFGEYQSRVHVHQVSNAVMDLGDTDKLSTNENIENNPEEFNFLENLASKESSHHQLLQISRQRIKGMCMTENGDLLVLARGSLYRYFYDMPWEPDRTFLWPPAFRHVAKAFLLCYYRAISMEKEISILRSLPQSIVVNIIRCLGGTLRDWESELIQLQQ